MNLLAIATLNQASDCSRMFWLKIVIVIGFASGLVYTRKLWSGGETRSCPRTPLFKNFNLDKQEHLLYASSLLLLGLTLVSPAPIWTVFLLIPPILALCFADWTRFRPWVYQNLSLLALIALGHFGDSPTAEEVSLNTCRLLLVSIYFWSGLLKVNRRFVQFIFPQLMAPLANRLPSPLAKLLRVSGYSVPVIEAGLALGLLFPATRLPSIIMVTGMHFLILLCFSPLGHQGFRSIWPWNLGMLACDYVLFWNSPEILWSDIVWNQGSGVHLSFFLVFTALPLLGLFNLLDPVFSHGHMAGRHVDGDLLLSRRLYHALPAEKQALCQQLATPNGILYGLSLAKWYMMELRVPPIQQERLFLEIARDFSRYGPVQGDLLLIVSRMQGWRELEVPKVTFGWNDLKI